MYMTLYGDSIALVSYLEASYYASMGGVLLLVYQVRCVVPYSVCTCVVSHPTTIMINDT